MSDDVAKRDVITCFDFSCLKEKVSKKIVKE